MRGFYLDNDKLDIVQAEKIIAEYVEERAGMKSCIRPNQVLCRADVPDNSHNYVRIQRVIEENCRELDGHNVKTFEFPDPDDITPFPTDEDVL